MNSARIAVWLTVLDHHPVCASGRTMGPSPKIIPVEGERPNMRSDRVFDALHTLRNRYMLCQLASKATRKFHKPNTRIQETMNDVFDKIADAERHDILSEPENFAEAQRRAA
ncbi:MAG TPA: hypothetical protein VJW96_08145 [Terriglobales bacterium]|nr:hypothetical protein [Terriglobales bacterium]